MDIHKSLDMITLVAKKHAQDHRCNYNIIISNPDKQGLFDPECSTYEYVADSYFEKPRPNAKLLYTTDELKNKENKNS